MQVPTLTTCIAKVDRELQRCQRGSGHRAIGSSTTQLLVLRSPDDPITRFALCSPTQIFVPGSLFRVTNITASMDRNDETYISAGKVRKIATTRHPGGGEVVKSATGQSSDGSLRAIKRLLERKQS
jgi:hypothetical protein